MGLDGGTIPSRTDLLRRASWRLTNSRKGLSRSTRGGQINADNFRTEDPALSRTEAARVKLNYCALSGEALPLSGRDVFCDFLGNLFRGEAIREWLGGTGRYATAADREPFLEHLGHIRKRADVFELKLAPVVVMERGAGPKAKTSAPAASAALEFLASLAPPPPALLPPESEPSTSDTGVSSSSSASAAAAFLEPPGPDSKIPSSSSTASSSSSSTALVPSSSSSSSLPSQPAASSSSSSPAPSYSLSALLALTEDSWPEKKPRFRCWISTDVETTGKHVFVALPACGHVFAEKTLRELKAPSSSTAGSSCPECSTPYAPSPDSASAPIPLNGTEEQTCALVDRLLARLRTEFEERKRRKQERQERKAAAAALALEEGEKRLLLTFEPAEKEGGVAEGKEEEGKGQKRKTPEEADGKEQPPAAKKAKKASSKKSGQSKAVKALMRQANEKAKAAQDRGWWKM